MKLSFLLLLGGTGTAALAGPCRPHSSSSGLSSSGSAKLPGQGETSGVTSATGTGSYAVPGLPSTAEESSSEATQSYPPSYGVPSHSSGVDLPSGSGSASTWLTGSTSDSTWRSENTPSSSMPTASGAITTDGNGNTVTIPGSEETTTGVVTTDEIGNTVTIPGSEETSGVVNTDENSNTVTIPVPKETTAVVTTDENGYTVTIPSSEEAGVVTTDENGNTVTIPGSQETTAGDGTATGTATGTETDATGGTAASSNTDTTESGVSGTETSTDTEAAGTNTYTTEPGSTQTATSSVNNEASTGGQTTEPNTDTNGSTTFGTAISTTISTAVSTDYDNETKTTTSADSTANSDDTTQIGGDSTTSESPSSNNNPLATSSETDEAGETTTSPGSEKPTIAPSTTNSMPPQTTEPGATMTSGPVSTTQSEDDGITSTMTAPPEGFSPTTVSNDKWTNNTWITTTSEGSDEPTVVPVLVGCPGCGGDGFGIVIFGFPPIVGTLFKFPGFPGFSFPCLPTFTPSCNTPPKSHEDGDDDDDDDDEDESSTKSEEASTTCTDVNTTSDCLVSCPTEDVDGEAECTTTCTKTHTGCSVSGITTTTSAQECSATEGGASCSTCPDEIFIVNDNDEVEAVGDDTVLRKRVSPAEQITDIGGGICTLQKMGVEFPSYPSGGDLMTADRAGIKVGDPFFDTKRWYIGRMDAATCARSLQQVSWRNFNKRTLTASKKKTMDHVYEKSFLRDFFTQILDAKAKTVQGVTTGIQDQINCADLAYYTDDDPALPGPNLLQQVYDAFPSQTKYLNDFMGMDDYANSICKGTITTPGTLANEFTNVAGPNRIVQPGKQWSHISKWMDNGLQMLEKLKIGVEVWNRADVKEITVRQTDASIRDYVHLDSVNIDNNAINCKNDDAVTKNVWSFSRAYQTYMNELFAGTSSYSINPIVESVANDLKTQMRTNFANLQAMKSTLSASEQADVAKWTARFAPLDTATYSVTITWDFTYTNLKRDVDDNEELEEGPACVLPTSLLISSLSTFSTSIISNSKASIETTQAATTTEDTATRTSSGPSEPTTTTCPGSNFVPTVKDGKISDDLFKDVPMDCVCNTNLQPVGDDEQHPYATGQLKPAIDDFCDGSRTLEGPVVPYNPVFKTYQQDPDGYIKLSVMWDMKGPDCEPSADVKVRLAEYCKTALHRFDCPSKGDGMRYGGVYHEEFEDDCYVLSWRVSAISQYEGDNTDKEGP